MMNRTPLNMKRLAGFLLVAVAATAQPRINPNITLTSREGRFQIDMPGQAIPKSSKVDSAMGPLTIFSFTVEVGSVAYVVMYNDYPKPVNTEVALENVGKGQVGDGNLIKSVALKINGYPGRGYVFEKGGLRVISQNYLVGSRLYQVMFGGPKAAADPPNLSHYFDSFKLLQ